MVLGAHVSRESSHALTRVTRYAATFGVTFGTRPPARARRIGRMQQAHCSTEDMPASGPDPALQRDGRRSPQIVVQRSTHLTHPKYPIFAGCTRDGMDWLAHCVRSRIAATGEPMLCSSKEKSIVD